MQPNLPTYNSHSKSISRTLQTIISAELNQLFELELSLSNINIEQPRESKHGDYATNIAMMLARHLGKSPVEIAKSLCENLNTKQSEIATFEIAGPGFVNIKMSNIVCADELKYILKDQDTYGAETLGEGKKVMVEFGQPNTHKAFHIGHLRSAISGLSLVGLYNTLGYDVIRANFYGDVGMHVAKCVWGFQNQERPGDWEDLNEHERMRFIDSCYVFGSKMFKEDPKSEQEIRELNKTIYAKTPGESWDLYIQTRDWSLEHLNSAFKQLGVEYDVQYPESTVSDIAIEIVKKHIGDVFEPSDGAIIYNGAKDGLNTWVFLTKEGLPTYSGKDLGLAYRKFSENKLDLGFVTTSVEQKDYFRAIIKVLEKIQPETHDKYKHIPFGWLLRSNKKMSSRMGDTVKGMDIIDEAKTKANELISEEKKYDAEMRKEIVDAVAIAGLKFLILSHEFHKDINYDPENFITLNGFSGPYLLYTYARARSVLRNSLEDLDCEYKFDTEVEKALLHFLPKYKDAVVNAALNFAPHILCNYLYELAQLYNKFYAECPILDADPQTKSARLKLCQATSQLIKNGLGILGIKTVEVM